MTEEDQTRDAQRDKYVALANSVPDEGMGAVNWLTHFAMETAAGDVPAALALLARLYVAADNYAAQNELMIDAAKQAARDFHSIIKKHSGALALAAYETEDQPALKVAATELLNAAGLSKYHAQEAA